MAKLAAFVHVTDDRGENHAFGPDDEVPEWAQSKITFPLAWVDGVVPTQVDLREQAPPPPPAKKVAAKRAPRRKAANDDAVHGA